MTADQDRLRRLAAEHGAELGSLLAQHGEDYGIYPLSHAQRRLWVLTELHPETAAYNVPYAFRVTGPLDVPALRRALDGLVARHEMLRTVFLATDGEPWQMVLPETPATLQVEDRPEVVGDADRQSFAAYRAAEEAVVAFDLSTGPLLRVRLVRFDPQDAVLMVTLHHIVCDGWSMQVIFGDLERHYRAELDRQTAPADPPATRYVDHARRQREWLTGEVAGDLAGYWAEQLAGAPSVIELPADRPRAALPQMKGGIERFSWPDSLATRITEFARHEQTTPFTVLLAAFAALLHRYTGQDDIVIGAPVANRTQVATEDVVGFFVNMLPMRCEFPPAGTFRQLTRQVAGTVVAAQAHQELPFEILVDRLRRDSNAAHHPLFQVVCAFHDEEFEQLRLPGLSVQWIPSHSETAKFDLSLSFSRGVHALTGWLEYDSALFDRDNMAAALDHLRQLLEAALATPDSPVATLALLSAAEEEQLLYGWNHTALAMPDDRLTYELIEERADKEPDAIAVSCGTTRLTYRQLDEAANRLAHRLIARGVGPERLVGILLNRSVDLAVCALAVWKSGAAYLPLDPANPQDRLRFIAEDARVELVLTRTDLGERLPAGVATLCLDTAPGPDAGKADRPARTAGPANLAYVIYTSGSTGRPKGAMIPHRGLRNLVNAVNAVLAPARGDRILQFASFAFDASVYDLALCLSSGAELVFAPREQLQPGPDLVQTLRRHEITMVLLPPTTAALLDPAEVTGLRSLVLGGEACPPDVAAAWSSGRALFNAYGPTEASVITTMTRMLGTEHRISIGCPLPNYDVYVLDEWMQPTPVGVPGELYIGGAGVARGYLHRPGLTAERFVPDPFSGEPGARLYRTGDIVRYRADAQLEFVRRADGQVKIRGLRIELGEIQAVLSQLAGVRTSLVAARECGPADVRLVAYVVPEPGVGADPVTLRRALREVLPEYMVPAHFVVVDGIPQTPNGKVDHAALARLDLAEPPDAATITPPHTDIERDIAEIWQELLGVRRVGRHDNFFDLGGNSLLITKVRARLEQRLGLRLATLTFFRHPTVHDLAADITTTATANRPVTKAAGTDRSAHRARGRSALAQRSRRRQAGTDGE